MKNIIVTIFILCTALYSYGCDCLMYPIESYVNKVDVIFTGKVIEVLDTIDSNSYMNTPKNREFYKGKGFRVKVLVIKRLKTGLFLNDTLEFTSDLSNCDPIYKLNESYLFFADKTLDGKFKMSHCTYWGTLKESKANIKKLKAKLKK